MHISEGIVSAPVLATGFVATATVLGVALKKLDPEDVPKIAVITSVFFVASLIKVPLGPTSIHLLMNGLAAVILGMNAFVAVFVGLVFQAILFGHGGVTVLGVNAAMIGGGALAAYLVWQTRHRFNIKSKEVVFGALSAAVAVMTSGVIMSLALYLSGEEFFANAVYVLWMHVPIMVIEGIVVGACAGFLKKVKPELLAGHVLATK